METGTVYTTAPTIVCLDPGAVVGVAIIQNGLPLRGENLSFSAAKDCILTYSPEIVIMERAVSRGGIVGKSTFETVEQQGRFIEFCDFLEIPLVMYTRSDVLKALKPLFTGITEKTPDARVRAAMRNRYFNGSEKQMRYNGFTGNHAPQALALWACYQLRGNTAA